MTIKSAIKDVRYVQDTAVVPGPVRDFYERSGVNG